MDSQFLDDLKNFFHKANFLNTFNSFAVSFDCEEPNYGFHSSPCPDKIFNFLTKYQKELLDNKSVGLNKYDLETSEFKKIFKSIFYFLWKFLIRFQEIYWSKNYEFNLAEELIFSSNYADLLENIENNKGFIIVNTGDHSIKINDEKLLKPANFCVSLNSSFVCPVETEDDCSFVFIPIY